MYGRLIQHRELTFAFPACVKCQELPPQPTALT
jgi:hypothetical protein